MPAFSYEAVDANGKTSKGLLEADSAKSARSQLRAQNLVPLRVETVSAQNKGKGLNREIWSRPALGASALTIWTRQLSGLVGSGLALERALSVLADETENEAIRKLMAALRADVNAGSSFAKALAQFPREFSNVYQSVIAAGEQSGQLGNTLLSLADDLEQQQNLKSKIVAASLYPAIVSGIAFFIIMFLMSYVVPQVAQVFQGSKRTLPILTVIMLGISSFVRSYGWYMLIAMVLSIFGIRQMLKTKKFRLAWDGAWLNAPLFGRMLRNYHSARFAATLALLASAGVPILKSLQTAAQTLGNAVLRSDAEEALVLVREGAPLASALAHKKRFPSLLTMFARLGEQTGELPTMLSRAAKQLANEVERRATALATLLEPLLIVTMGIIVMLIVLSVLLPIIELNQLVK